MPPALLEEVFALNEELDEIRELRAGGRRRRASGARGCERARQPIERKRDEHEAAARRSCRAQWDALLDGRAGDAERRAVLDALRERMLERNYINNLLATIEREPSRAGSACQRLR